MAYKWTKEEISTLKRDYLEKGELHLSILLNKSPNAIRIKAFRVGLSKLALRENIKLIDSEEQIILGGLLGDLYCRIKRSCKNAQIEGAHSKKQEPYLLWKIKMLPSLSFNLRRTKLGYLFFESRTYPCLNEYYNLFYKEGKKKITQSILKKINQIGLAIWYMDDGSYAKRDRRCSLHTNGFTYDENLIIKEWFELRWNLFPKIYSHKEPKRYPGKVWYFLNFNTIETKKLLNLIKDYIHPSMKYKLGV